MFSGRIGLGLFVQMVGALLRRAWRWIKRPKNYIGVGLVALGLPGSLDDIGGWIKWLNQAGSAILPVLQNVPIEQMIGFLSSEWVPWFILGAAVCVFEINNIAIFVRWIADRIGYGMAAALDQEHYISEDAAVSVIARSSWALSRKRLKAPSLNPFEDLQRAFLTVNPALQEREKKFKNWCRLVLEKFEQEWKESTRNKENTIEYDEIKLKEWLEERYSDDLVEEFGAP